MMGASSPPHENDSIKTKSAYGTSNTQGPGYLFGIVQGRVVVTLIRHARRRFLKNELLSQGANAISAALIAFIILLLLGTEVLGWQWLALIPAAAAGLGIYRARKRTPSAYRIAQLVDRRLDLSDTLSTAYFFQQEANGASRPSDEMLRCHLQRAEDAAQSADIRRAVPYIMPRAAYVMAALVLVASSLFALRYGISRRLDLRPPLAQMLQEQMGWTPKTQVAKETRRKQPQPPTAQQDDPGASAEDQKRGEAQPESQQSNDSEMAGQQESPKNGADQKGDPKQQADGKKGGEDGDAQAEEKSDSANDPS